MRALLAASLCVLCLASTVQAQERRPLTQARALGLAEERAPDVLVSLADAAVAQSEVGVAGMFPDPTIGGGVSPNYTFIATFFIQLPVFGQRAMAERAALARSRVAEASVDVQRLDAGLAASLGWIDLWETTARRSLAEEEAARFDLLAAAAAARVEDGTAPELERIRADADKHRAHFEIEALRASEVAASARLAFLLGDEGGATLSPAGDPSAPAPPSVASLDRRLGDHPASRQAHLSIHSAEAAVDSEHRARWPQLGVAVSDWYARSGNTHDVRVVGTINVPIFDEPRITREEARLRAAEARGEAVRARLRSAAISARADYVAARRRCAALADAVVPAVRDAASRSQDAYAEGSLDLASVQLAEQARVDAERQLLSCRATRARAWARLAHAAGGLHAD